MPLEEGCVGAPAEFAFDIELYLSDMGPLKSLIDCRSVAFVDVSVAKLVKYHRKQPRGIVRCR